MNGICWKPTEAGLLTIEGFFGCWMCEVLAAFAQYLALNRVLVVFVRFRLDVIVLNTPDAVVKYGARQ